MGTPERCPQFPILLADDEDNDALLVRRAFQKAIIPAQVLRVKDGEEAIAYLKGENKYKDRTAFPMPLLLLLDLKMPRKTGFEVLKWVRSQEKLRRLFIVVLTSSRQSPDVNWAYDLGANSYLVKPVDFNDLVTIAAAIHNYWLDLCQKPDLPIR